MCGIIGMVGNNQGQQVPLMNEMLEIMSHRGPDARDSYTNDHATLGHLRLSIIDLDGGTQPLFNEDKTLCIVFNGEIYNYKDIRKTLISKGVQFSTDSDTEVLLKGYEYFGESIVSQLNGIFSFAILHIGSDKIFLARDQFGIKPLFYYYVPGLLVFASEQKAILLHPEVKRSVNHRALHIHLNLRYTQSEETLFQGLKQLQAGYHMTYADSKISINQYYQMKYEVNYDMTEKEAVDQTNFYLKQAIERQLVSDVPVGVYLSGGLDSSTIVQKMSELGIKDINTFTLGFNEPTDEFSDAKLIAQQFGTNHREMSLSFNPLKMFPEVLWHAEQPKINLLQGFNMSKFVQPHVKVILGGLGGDELFAGYDIHRIVNPSNKFHKHIPSWMKGLMRWKSDFLFKVQHATKTLKYDEYRRGMQMLLSIGDIQKYYLILRNVWEMDAGMHKDIYSAEFLKKHQFKTDVWDEFKPYFEKSNEFQPLDQVLYTELHTKMVNDYLLVDDRMSMANGIEERVPFLDMDLVEFGNSIPLHLKIKSGKTKYILREALKPYLPKRIIHKKKWGFSVNPYLQFNKDLKTVSEKILTKEFIETQGIFNYNYIHQILHTKPHPKMRWHYNLIWVLMGYAMWQKMYIDGDGFKQKEFRLEQYY